MMPSWMCCTTESILEDLRLRQRSAREERRKLNIGVAKHKNSRFGGVKFNRARRQRP